MALEESHFCFSEPSTQLYANPQNEQFRFYVLARSVPISYSCFFFYGKKKKTKIFFKIFLSLMWDMMHFLWEGAHIFHQALLLPCDFFLGWTILLFCRLLCRKWSGHTLHSISDALFISLCNTAGRVCWWHYTENVLNLCCGEIGFRSTPKKELTIVTRKDLKGKKKSPVYFLVLRNCKSSVRMHQQRTLMWPWRGQSRGMRHPAAACSIK